jgi:hypothetical protein
MRNNKQRYHKVNRYLNPVKIESVESGKIEFTGFDFCLFHESVESGKIEFTGFDFYKSLKLLNIFITYLNPVNPLKLSLPDLKCSTNPVNCRIRIFDFNGFNPLKSLRFKSGESVFPKGNKTTGLNAGLFF